MDIMEKGIQERYQNIEWALDERQKRLFCANEAKILGHGGVSIVSRVTGVARGTISTGLRELEKREYPGSDSDRVRKPGGEKEPDGKGSGASEGVGASGRAGNAGRSDEAASLYEQDTADLGQNAE